MQKSELNVVMGAMTFGASWAPGTRVHKVEDVNTILNIFQKHGHYEVDTARVYGIGTSEEYLAKADWPGRGLAIATKLYPTTAHQGRFIPKITHNEKDVKRFIHMSLNALQTECTTKRVLSRVSFMQSPENMSIDMWYLHGPDRTTPYEVTLKAVDDMYRAGKFKRFGISNYMAWEVAEIVGICKAKGYVMPSVYQGIYNAVHRGIEAELIPCLRKYGISYYAFNPLGGGFFTGRYRSMQDSVERGSRFDDNGLQGKMYRERYWKEQYFAALSKIEVVAKKHNLTLAEIALRWISHHSALKRAHGDSVLIGASSVKHIEQNLLDLEKGPLPEEVVSVLDEAWKSVEPVAAPYYH